jgi:hypothetical protein
MIGTVKSWAAGVAVAVAVLASGAGAQSGPGPWPCGASGYSLTCTKAGDTLTVSGTGRMEDYAPRLGPMPAVPLNISASTDPAPWSAVRWVVIGNGVTYIGKFTFDNPSLQEPMVSVKVNAESPPSVGDSAFFQGRMKPFGVSLFVPQSQNIINAYKTAPVWKDFGYINPSTVTFDAQNGNNPTTRLVSYGDTVAKPVDPIRVGFIFDGWYRPSAVGDVVNWDFSTAVRSEIILFAAWKTSTSVLGQTSPNIANIAVRQIGRVLKISTLDRTATRYGVELYSVSGKRQSVSPVYHADGVITVALPRLAAGSYVLRVGDGKNRMERRVVVR